MPMGWGSEGFGRLTTTGRKSGGGEGPPDRQLSWLARSNVSGVAGKAGRGILRGPTDRGQQPSCRYLPPAFPLPPSLWAPGRVS